MIRSTNAHIYSANNKSWIFIDDSKVNILKIKGMDKKREYVGALAQNSEN